MVGHCAASHGVGKLSDSLPGSSTFADSLFAMNITLKIFKVSFISEPLLSCSAIYEMASSMNMSGFRRIIVGSLPIAAAARLMALDAAGYFPPPESQGGWRKLEAREEIRRDGRMDP